MPSPEPQFNAPTDPKAPPADQPWFHVDGTLCVAGWHGEGPKQGRCLNDNGPVTPCPDGIPVLRDLAIEADRWRSVAGDLWNALEEIADEDRSEIARMAIREYEIHLEATR